MAGDFVNPFLDEVPAEDESLGEYYRRKAREVLPELTPSPRTLLELALGGIAGPTLSRWGARKIREPYEAEQYQKRLPQIQATSKEVQRRIAKPVEELPSEVAPIEGAETKTLPPTHQIYREEGPGGVPLYTNLPSEHPRAVPLDMPHDRAGTVSFTGGEPGTEAADEAYLRYLANRNPEYALEELTQRAARERAKALQEDPFLLEKLQMQQQLAPHMLRYGQEEKERQEYTQRQRELATPVPESDDLLLRYMRVMIPEAYQQYQDLDRDPAAQRQLLDDLRLRLMEQRREELRQAEAAPMAGSAIRYMGGGGW
jgi:hypothetical protein